MTPNLHILPTPDTTTTTSSSTQASASSLPPSPAPEPAPAEMFAAEMSRRFAATLCDDLQALSQAETPVEGKSGQSGTKPEWAIRLKVAELKLNFLAGRGQAAASPPPTPAAASPALSFDDLLAELHRSPACLQTLQGMIEQTQPLKAR